MVSRRTRRMALGFAAALVVVALFLRAVGWRAVAAEAGRADPLVFGAGFLAVVGSFLCWSEALRRLLGTVHAEVPGGLRYRAAFMTGEFAKQVVPLGHSGGPVFVSYAVARRTDARYDETLAAATVVEFVNVAASVLLAIGGLTVYLATRDGPVRGVLVALLVGLVVAVCALVGAVTLVHYRRRLVRRAVLRVAAGLRATAGRLSARVRAALAAERVAGGFDAYYGAFDRVLTDRRRVLQAGALSLVGWALFLVPLYTSFLAIDAGVSYSLVVFVVPVLSLVNVVPLPGGLGGFEVALAGVLDALVGMGLPVATAGVFLYRLSNYWFVVALGGAASVLVSVPVSDQPALLPAEAPDGGEAGAE